MNTELKILTFNIKIRNFKVLYMYTHMHIIYANKKVIRGEFEEKKKSRMIFHRFQKAFKTLQSSKNFRRATDFFITVR